MRPPVPVAIGISLILASSSVHAADSHPLQPSAPRTVMVSEADTPPQIRAGLLQSTLIVLPAEEKVASVFAGDTVAWVFDGGHVASRFVSVKPKVANGSTDIHIVSDHGNEYTLQLTEVSNDADPHFDSKVFINPGDQVGKDRLAQLHTHPVRAGDLTHFLLRLILCSLLINYWVNPFPGASFGINHFFSYIAQAMVAAFDQSSLDNLLQLLKTAGDGTAMPSLMAPMQILCYFYVQGLLGIASAILFVINCSSFILYGVTALFGPVFIPLLMTQTFRAKFFHFLDVLISFAMIRAVAAAFIFVWGGFMNTFIQQTFNGTYSIAMWLANLIPCTMVFIAFIINMLFIPSMTQAIFGGSAGLTSAAPGLAGSVAGMTVLRGGGA